MSVQERPIYYCVLQGSLSKSVFISDRDKQGFLATLQDIKSTHAFKLYAFALLESQVHLALRPMAGGVGPIMSTLISNYAQQYNRRNNLTGYLFNKVFECKQCHSDHQVLPLVRFMHYLPVQLGHCHHPNLARWTSHLAYLGDPRYSFIDSADILELLAGEQSHALRLYQGLMAQSGSTVKSEGSFVQAMTQPDVIRESDAVPYTPPSLTLEAIAEFVTKATGVSVEVMRGKGRAEHVVEARRMFIAAAVMVCSFSVSDVAKFLHVHHSYVSRLTFIRSEASKAMAETAKEFAATLQRKIV
ncbi:MAG: hypothetical protein FD169_1551 [Bacillota bacterium]|nr:MAG: hypothetical protein FD169_1551 [Bacillota bacterium]